MRVIVVGLRGPQEQILRALLPGDVEVKVLSPAQALRAKQISPDLVILTRFVNHKHSCRLRRRVRVPVQMVPHGGAAAVASAVIQAIGARIAP